MRLQTGFTIIELMIAIIILSIALAWGVPSFQTLIQNNRLVSQTNQLTSLLALARSEAAKRPDVLISVCTSSDGSSCSGSANWENGWIIMTDADGDRALDTEDTNNNGVLDNEDANGNGTLDAGEDTNGNGTLDNEDLDGDGVIDADQILLYAQPLSGGNTLRTTGFSSGNTFLQFFSDGTPTSSGTFVICDSRGTSFAKAIAIAISGQSRLAVDENSDGIVNTHAGSAANVTCP